MSEGYWLMNRETGEGWHSCDPPQLIEYVPRGDMQAYRLRKLEERVKRLEQSIMTVRQPRKENTA